MVLGLVVAGVGTLTSRVDVVLIALPLLISAAIGFDRKPLTGARSILRVDVARRANGEGTTEFEYRVVVEPPKGTELVHLRLTLQGSFSYELILAPGFAAITGHLPIVHSGRQRAVEVGYRLVGVDGAWRSLPVREVVERVVNPAIAPIASVPLPHRLTGLTGLHRSARPGDGGEFRDLHPYAPGDRLRRIDWKATARRSQGFGDLYVRRTDATSDATLMLVIDSREDVGERIQDWSARPSSGGGLSSMDLAREAASSLAVAAMGMGDRVGLVSTFLDDDVTSVALLWRAAGHRVIAVDVLPTPLFDGSEVNTRVAHRIVIAERRRRIADMRANGVELFRWQEDAEQPSRVVVLRTLARAGRARR